jgi:uncharacterized protein YndB with AHSA1/START domain
MDVTREVVLPVTREEAWRALTDAERLGEWFANDVELDATPGGVGVFRWDNGEERHATVEIADEGEALVLRFEDAGRVELVLEDDPNGTLVRVRETAPEWGIALELEACAAWAIA